MNTPNHRAISAYVQTGVETAVPEADAHRLVLMLFEGALSALADARIKMMEGDIPGRGHAISRAISIIDQGLLSSLNTEKGGELAARMSSLYAYITTRLLQANLRAEKEGIEEAARLISELHSAWKAIGAPREGESARDATLV
jgi:flagellar secretion chaperone FliS